MLENSLFQVQQWSRVISQASIPEYIDGLPNICGSEDLVAEAMAQNGPFYLPKSGVDFGNIRSAFASRSTCTSRLIPAGGDDLRTAAVIGNLKHMMDNPGIGDNHNASVFAWCYKRMGEFIPQLVEKENNRASCWITRASFFMGCGDGAGLRARRSEVDYADPAYAGAVEWLGTAWGHAVAPSTPAQDFRLHVRAWQHHFARYSASMRSPACAAFRRRRWRCRTIPMSPTSSCGR